MFGVFSNAKWDENNHYQDFNFIEVCVPLNIYFNQFVDFIQSKVFFFKENTLPFVNSRLILPLKSP